MPKKTLALITGLVIVTIVLFIIALRAGQQQQAPATPTVSPMASQPTPFIPVHTVLQLSPNPLTVAPGQQGRVDVVIDTSDNNVTAVQLELGYDPNVVGNVKVVPGPLFTNTVVLLDRNNPTSGRYTYEFGISPGGQPVVGKGVVASITFTTLPGTTGKSTQIGLLPTSLVTARGVEPSVLKSETGTVITIGSGGVNQGSSTSGNSSTGY